jgi:RHS repeat-associated protein
VESSLRPGKWEEFREDYRFTGKEDDVEVGLVYFGKRYYAPLLGRWVSADPLAIHAPGEADLNLYAYVHGRALIAVDPVGLEGLVREGPAIPLCANGVDFLLRNKTSRRDVATAERQLNQILRGNEAARRLQQAGHTWDLVFLRNDQTVDWTRDGPEYGARLKQATNQTERESYAAARRIGGVGGGQTHLGANFGVAVSGGLRNDRATILVYDSWQSKAEGVKNQNALAHEVGHSVFAAGLTDSEKNEIQSALWSQEAEGNLVPGTVPKPRPELLGQGSAGVAEHARWESHRADEYFAAGAGLYHDAAGREWLQNEDPTLYGIVDRYFGSGDSTSNAAGTGVPE